MVSCSTTDGCAHGVIDRFFFCQVTMSFCELFESFGGAALFEYPSLQDEDEYLELLAEGGFMVEKIAKLLYPGGQEMPLALAPEKAAETTLRALKAQNVTLFEATLISGHKLARIDILRKRGNEFHLIEVKAASYDSDENAAAIADGRLNLFRTKRNRDIVAGWREYMEDITFQLLVLRELFPNAKICAFLMMPDKSKTARIDGLHSRFRIQRRLPPGSRFDRYEVEFTGDPDELRREHLLTLVPVDAEVMFLAEEVAQKADEYAATLNPTLRRIATPVSVTCKGCEYRSTQPDQPDGFRECWGTLADVNPHLLDLYHVSSVGGRGGPVVNRLVCVPEAVLSPGHAGYGLDLEALERGWSEWAVT